MGCGTKLLKIILITINIIFFLAGAAVLGVGIYIRVEPQIASYVNAVGLNEFASYIHTAAYILIAFGAFTFVVGFCGCCGAIKESKILLGIYVAAVLVIIGAEIGGGVYAYVQKDPILISLRSLGSEFLQDNYGKANNNVSTLAWDEAMLQLECCGINGVSDFNNSYFRSNSRNAVPDSCCKVDDNRKVINSIECQQEARSATGENSLNRDSCEQKLVDFIEKNAVILLGVAAGVAAFELLVLISAICLCCNIDKDD